MNKSKLSKDSPKYWKSRVLMNSYTEAGRSFVTSTYSVKIQFKGRRETFALNTGDRDVASRKARKIYLFLMANGWEESINRFKPKAETPAPTTLGEFIAVARGVFAGSPKTFTHYTNSAQLISSEIAGIKAGKERYSYRNGKYQEWLSKINSIKLTRLTKEAVEAWR